MAIIGKRLLKNFRQAVAESEDDRVFECLTDEEKKELKTIMQKVVDKKKVELTVPTRLRRLPSMRAERRGEEKKDSEE